MRARRFTAALGIASLGVIALLACVDLFHSTDVPNLCDIDAKADGCASDAAPDSRVVDSGAPTNFCSWDGGTANTNAQRSCAWLGACELPIGDNAFGACMVHAIQAYDCNANPARTVKGPLHAFWDALWQAKSCGDVDKIVFEGPFAPTCSSGSMTVACTAQGQTRVQCEAVGAPAKGENCGVSGRTCDPSNFQCTSSGGGACDASSCQGTRLLDCEDGGDLGLDCANFGAGNCVTPAGFPGCAPANSSPSCDASTAVVCSDAGVALGCATGVLESLDCNVLTGPATCVSGTPVPVWDLSAACLSSAGTGEAGVCGADTCTNGTIASCARGALFTTLCSAQGLGQCTTANTVDGPRAQCGPPTR